MKTLRFLVLVLGIGSTSALAEVRLPALISDHAMFQANRPVALWGWSGAGELVKVTFVDGSKRSRTVTVTVGSSGKWVCVLPAQADGVVGELRIEGKDGAVKVVHDVLFGEVWLGSGQSNMEYDVVGTGRVDKTRADEVAEVAQNVQRAREEASAAVPPIRYFRVMVKRAATPMEDVEGHWILVRPDDAERCSAVGWNFAVALENRLHVPVGMIVSAVGNTPIETWMSKETLLSTTVGARVIERSEAEVAEATPKRVAQYQAAFDRWKAAHPTAELQSEHSGSRPVAPANLSARNYVPNQYFNGMIYGLQPYTIRGILWYQGASNMFHPREYGEMFVAMIREWRALWNDPQLPFLFVEESNFGAKQTEPVEPNGISTVREQQHDALKLSAVGMAVSMDLGNGNPHYPNKRAIALRLAELALVQCYGAPGDPLSPVVKTMKAEGARVRLTLAHAEGVHVAAGGEVQGFALRAEGGAWHWATGKIEGGMIIVWSDEVSRPAAVRYAWAQNPVSSVVNAKGLPLDVFRSDADAE